MYIYASYVDIRISSTRACSFARTYAYSHVITLAIFFYLYVTRMKRMKNNYRKRKERKSFLCCIYVQRERERAYVYVHTSVYYVYTHTHTYTQILIPQVTSADIVTIVLQKTRNYERAYPLLYVRACHTHFAQ